MQVSQVSQLCHGSCHRSNFFIFKAVTSVTTLFAIKTYRFIIRSLRCWGAIYGNNP